MRRWLILPAMLLPFLIWYDCNFRIRVHAVEICDAKVQQELRIAHFSDLCGLNWGDDNRIIIETIARHAPDLICITGTMVTEGDESGRIIAGKLVSALRAIAPVIFTSRITVGHSRYVLPADIAGLGNAPERLFRPPEIRIITLKPMQQ